MAFPSERAAAFERLYRTTFRAVEGYARRRVPPDEAEDVVEETFLVVWRRLEAVPEGEAARLWVFGVARRVVAQRLRSLRRKKMLEERMAGFRERPAVTDQLDEGWVNQVLARLRPIDQEVLRLAAWEGLAPREMAVVLGCSANAASLRLHRARRRFRHALDEREGSA
jgi:RNA polymerase sigma-70 factor (ECF subfamily)